MIVAETWEDFQRFVNRKGWAWNNLLGQRIDHPYLNFATPQQYGAKGDGVNDDTAAMQSAHDTGKCVYYQAGTYKFSTITLAAGGIIGDGQNQTILSTTDASSAEVIKFNGAGQVSYNGTSAGPVFEGFKITTTATKTGGGLITLEPSSGEISFARFTGVAFAGGWDQIKTVAASHWRVHHCTFINYAQAGIRVQNTNNNDSGDSVITGCIFNCGVVGEATQTGILQLSSAGLKVIGNKFLGGAYGYLMLAVLSSNCAGFYFVGNSVENQSVAGLQFDRTSGAFGWGSIVVSGNEFATIPLHIVSNDTDAFISDMTISGNTFAQIVSTNTAISIDHTTDFYITGNKFDGTAGSNGGISIGSGAVSGHIGRNKFRNITTEISNGSTDVEIDFSPTKSVTLANGLNSNVSTARYGLIQIVGPTGAFSVGGFVGTQDGKVQRVINSVNQTMTIVNEDVSSTAANRIATLTGGNVALRATAPSAATFVYSGASGRWILMATN